MGGFLGVSAQCEGAGQLAWVDRAFVPGTVMPADDHEISQPGATSRADDELFGASLLISLIIDQRYSTTKVKTELTSEAWRYLHARHIHRYFKILRGYYLR